MPLNANQELAAELLAQGKTKASIARRVGVNPDTIYEWLKKKEFQEVVARNRERILDTVRNEFSSLARASVRVMKKRLKDDDANPAVAAKVATSVLKSLGILKDSPEVIDDELDVELRWEGGRGSSEEKDS